MTLIILAKNAQVRGEKGGGSFFALFYELLFIIWFLFFEQMLRKDIF